MHVLRTQFTREKKKISAKKTTGSGATNNMSKWIYYDPLKFLLCGATTSGESDTMNEKTVPIGESSDLENETEPSPMPTPATPDFPRKRKKTNDLDEVLDIMKSAKKKMDERIEKDTFDVYGEYVTTELRSVKDDRAVTQAKYHINNILYELKMGRYGPYGYQTASYQPPTPSDDQTTSRQETNGQEADRQEETESALHSLVNYLNDQ